MELVLIKPQLPGLSGRSLFICNLNFLYPIDFGRKLEITRGIDSMTWIIETLSRFTIT